jgi:hypothetical protein
MELVNQGFVPGRLRGAVVAPGERRIHNGGKRGEGGVVPPVDGQVGGGVPDSVAKHLIAPAHRPADGLGVGIDQNFSGIKTMSFRGVVGPVNAEPVELPGSQVRNKAMPHPVRAFGEGNPPRFLPVQSVEKAQIHPGGVFGKEGEIHPPPVPGGAQGVGVSRAEVQRAPVEWAARPSADAPAPRSVCPSPMRPKRNARSGQWFEPPPN